MKIFTFIKRLAAVMLVLVSGFQAHAQYYEIANQLPSLIRPIISGSFNYKGFIDAGYSKTVGNYDADFLEFSTSQGFQYANWFYMGVGLGVDVIFAHQDAGWGNWDRSQAPGFDFNHKSTETAAMMPLFTDFRFTLGNSTVASFFIDLKVGCSFLLSNKYIAIGNGYITNQQYFYLRPSIGIKIPVSQNHPKQAVDIGITYKLLTSNYWNSWERNVTLNSFGATVAFEW